MKVVPPNDRRPGVAGILVAVMLFAMIFTAGIGYLLYTTSSNLSSYQANQQALAAHVGANEEQLVFSSSKTCVTNLPITVNNTGGIPLSVMSVFVKDSTGKLISPPGVMAMGGPYTSATGPLNLAVGGSGQFTLTGYSYNCNTMPIVYIYLLTSRGNIFGTQYPLAASVTTTTMLSSYFTTLAAPGGGGGNSLVVVMAATPVQVFSGNIITDNVSIFNYAAQSMTGATLQPSVPAWNTTGTATLTSQGCSGPYTPPGQQSDPSGTIPGYSGSGAAPHIYYLCTYKASSGAVGGLASFSGWAKATEGSTLVESASVTSNLVQIGGLTNVLYQGAFSSNFFFFKYTSCTNQPSGGMGGYSYPSGCTTNTSYPPTSVYNLPEGDAISGGSNYYVAFYVQITNNYNTTLPILQYTFEQFEQSAGDESDWWIVGSNTTMTNNVYYPNYKPGGTSVPTLTAYPTDCATVNSQGFPTDKSCLYVDPGKTVTITLAACGPSLAYWDWGGTRYGSSFDSGASGCTSSTPNIDSGGSSSGSATAGITVISFAYKGQILTEDIAFQGVAFTS
jgi:hypothetical protein